MESSLRISPGTIMSTFGTNTPDMNIRLTTGGMFGATSSFVPTNFIWNPPQDPRRKDLMRQCPITGYQGPASEFEDCDGLLVLRDFAVTRVNK